MLGKLFKYDMSALSRILVPVHLAVLVLGVIATVCGFLACSLDEMGAPYSGSESIYDMMTLIAILVMVLCAIGLTSAIVVTFVVILLRFYKNLFTDEGYLTLTLPVTAHQIVLAKLFAGIIWLIIDGVVVTLMIMLVSFASYGFVGVSVEDSLPYWVLETTGGFLFGMQDGNAVLGLVQTMIQAIEWLMLAYAAFALGASLAARHKVAAGIGLFILFSWVSNLIMSIGAIVLAFSSLATAGDIMSWVIYPLSWAYVLLLLLAGYFVCVYALTRKVNLA